MKRQHHIMPYQAYHSRQSHQELHQNLPINIDNYKNINNSNRNSQEQSQQQQIHFDNREHSFVTLEQQQRQHPTLSNFTKLQQQQQPLDKLTSFSTYTNIVENYCGTSSLIRSSKVALSATNAKMSSLTSGNVLFQSNFKLLQKQAQLPQQQKQNIQSYYNDSNKNNYYYFNNSNNNNSDNINPNGINSYQNNFEQQEHISKFTNINNFNAYNLNQQQQHQEQLQIMLHIKQEQETKQTQIQLQQKEPQYERRQQLRLPLATMISTTMPTQQLQQHNQQILQNAQKSVNNNQIIDNNNNFQTTNNVGDKLAMDSCEIANFLANELFMQQVLKNTKSQNM